MTYKNVTNTIAMPMIVYVHKNLFESKDPIQKHVLGRAAIIALTPVSMISCAIDMILCVGACFATLLSAGTCKAISDFAQNHRVGIDLILIQPYSHLLGFINPNAILQSPFKHGCTGKGIITGVAINDLFLMAESSYDSQNIFRRHVISRLTYGLIGLTMVVTRAVDGLIGIPFVVGSIYSLGIFPSINKIARKSLEVTAIISDLFFCITKVINPGAKLG